MKAPFGRRLWILVLLAVLAIGAYDLWSRSRPPAPPPEKPAAAAAPASKRRPKAASAGLHRPKPKPCKKLGDEGGELVMSQGLGEDEIRAAMNAFLPNALRCVPDAWTTDGTIDTRVTVGCDGVVDTVEVLDGGGFPPEMVRCVKETIGYTPFPAHDQPDGMVFDYPVRLSF